MGDIAQRGNRLTRGKKNLLEELGRVEGERSNPNRRAEISRVHGELNRGYAIGGVVKALKRAIPKPKGPKKPKSRDSETHGKDVRTMAAEGGRIGLKKGGSDKNWIQKATKGMVKTKPCTGKKFGSKSCPPGSKRYNLAKTFKKMGRERKAKG